MARSVAAKKSVKPAKPPYVLDEQVGFILRQVWQRHSAIFSREIGTNITPTQWAALSKLAEAGPCSQNQLGRLTAMDVATRVIIESLPCSLLGYGSGCTFC